MMAKRWIPIEGNGGAITVEKDAPDDSGLRWYNVWADGEKRPATPKRVAAGLLEAVYEPEENGR